MPINILLNGNDDYLKRFEINDVPDLCIITGINGSGKSRMLSKLQSGDVKVSHLGKPIGVKRITTINSTDFAPFQPHNRQFGSSSGMSHVRHFSVGGLGTELDQAINVESIKTLISDYIFSIVGDTYIGDDILEGIEALARLKFQNTPGSDAMFEHQKNNFLAQIGNYVGNLESQNYTDSISMSLRSYYDTLVNNSMTEIGRREGYQADEVEEPYNIEALINNILRKMKLNYEVIGGEEYQRAAKFLKIIRIPINSLSSATSGSLSRL